MDPTLKIFRNREKEEERSIQMTEWKEKKSPNDGAEKWGSFNAVGVCRQRFAFPSAPKHPHVPELESLITQFYSSMPGDYQWIWGIERRIPRCAGTETRHLYVLCAFLLQHPILLRQDDETQHVNVSTCDQSDSLQSSVCVKAAARNGQAAALILQNEGI